MKSEKFLILCIEEKELLKKYLKLKNRMDTIFMNLKNSETSDPQRLPLNLTNEIKLKRSEKYVAFKICSRYSRLLWIYL